MKRCLYCGGQVSDDDQSCPNCAGRTFGPVAEENWVEVTACGDKRRTFIEAHSGRVEYAEFD